MHSIAIVNVYRKREGITVAAKLYRDALGRAGFQTHFYQCVEGSGEDYIQDGIIVKGIPLPNRYLKKGLNRAIIFPLALRNLREDLILLSDPWLVNLARFRKNVIVLVYDLRLLTRYAENAAQSMLFKHSISGLVNAKAVISVSNVTRESLMEVGIRESSVAVIPLCTELESSGRSHMIKSLSKLENNEPLNVVYVAHDIPYKQISLFINIAAGLQSTEWASHFKFTILSKLQPVTLRMIRRSNNANLSVINEVDDLKEFYAHSDILLFPSEYEGFGMPLLEAMASGMPIVARDIPIVREVVKDAAYLVNSEDLSVWRKALVTLLDSVTYEAMAQKGISRSETFSRKRFEQRVTDIFHGLADGRFPESK